jgi:hypothetical protein
MFCSQAESRRSVKAVQLWLKLLVYEKQSFHCTTRVAVTGGYYLINCGVGGVWKVGTYSASHRHTFRLATVIAALPLSGGYRVLHAIHSMEPTKYRVARRGSPVTADDKQDKENKRYVSGSKPLEIDFFVSSRLW